MTEENARQGRRNKRKGNVWPLAAIRWLNEHGWPHAGFQRHNNANDLTGTWDLAIELTDTTWDKMWDKLRQAKDDATARGLTDYCVWKKSYGSTDPGQGEVIMRARQFFPLVMRLEKLEQASLDADDQFTRGWIAHEKYMQEKAAREAV